MKAPKTFLFDFQLTKDMEVRRKESSQEYILFFARSYEPQKNGLYFNALFQCFGDVKERVEHMKLKKGSVVDIIAEMSQYKRGDSYDTAYRVIDVSFSDMQREKPKEEPQKQQSFIGFLNDIFLEEE